jgi:two-component system CheB/CheR fusion protein
MTDTAGDGARSEPRQKLLVVGLGASAGGIEALRLFFAHVSANSGAAYVVILHLSPDHDSKLAEVLQTTASIPVMQVTHPVRVEANHVYVVPPNRRLEIVDGTLTLSEMTQREHRRSPVDVFFRALADANGSRSVGIVLSGTGPNGSAGLKRVKEYGGLTIAQVPEEAGHGEMPSNAIATGQVDLVLRVAEMPSRIADYRKRLQLIDTAPALVDPAEEPDALREILSLLRVRTGHDFANYKPATLMRRLQRRLHVVGLSDLTSYARMMREQPQEAVMLMKDLLISVTHFFRDPETFVMLEQRVVPRLFEHKTPEDQVRVWVPGCATGEEAYSIGMLLAEYSMGTIEPPHIQVFATDLDEDAIATARDGFYTDADVVDVPEQRLERFFHREGTGYRIRRELREMMLFAHHNVIKDPPFSHLDLISCRNLLIYLNRTAQERILETFHFALRPAALLMLGPSESPDSSDELFASFDRTAHIYESRTATSRLPPPEAPRAGPPRALPRTADQRPVERFAPLDAHHRLLEQYAPPSLVVTEDNTVVHMSTRAAEYLQMPAGEPTRDLLKLVRPELRVELRAALFRAAKGRTSAEMRHLPVTIEGIERHVDLSVRPVLREDDPARGFFLVLFADSDGAGSIEPRDRTLDTTTEPIARRLEEELSLVKAQLRTTVEQYEAQVEEAQASAEEHQAMNEELRSSAEELETSKEEIQSINEELTTVNQELKIKIEELRLTNNDLQNLINSTDLPTLFLDRSLRLKMTTSRAQDIFNVLPTDVGRPLSDITHRLTDGNITGDLRLVLDKLQAVDREVTTTDNRSYVMRIRPYRTSDDRIDGLVLMFQDVTARREAEGNRARSEERLKLLVDGVLDSAIFTMTQDGVIDSWNRGAERMFGYRAEQIVGLEFDVLFAADDRASGTPKQELDAAQRDGRTLHERYHLRNDGTRFFASGVTTRLGDGLGFAQIARDLTAPHRAAEALREARAETDRRVAEHARELQAVVAEHGAAQDHVVSLLRKIVTAQEDERGRIARNLHDQLGQRLTALRLSLERAQERLAKDGTSENELERALNLTHEIDSDVGFLSWELRPAVLEHLGLGVALPRYVREWSDHYGLEVEYKGDGYRTILLTHEAEVAFYRIAQEALTNIAKHAHASRIDMMLESRDHTVVLVVEDDGVGFDTGDGTVTGRGVGLLGMRERAGLIGAEFEIESKPGQGTSIFVKYRRPTAPPPPSHERHSRPAR